MVKASDLVRQYTTPRKDVVKGLIRQGEVVNICGGTKTRKSFFAMQLAISVANGIPFLLWDTVPGRVLIVDNEIQRDDLAVRLRAQSGSGLSLDNIDILPLRGQLADINAIRDMLGNRHRRACF